MVKRRDRISENDRRTAEAGPPRGWIDRRRFPERRMIGVDDASYEEWEEAVTSYSIPVLLADDPADEITADIQ